MIRENRNMMSIRGVGTAFVGAATGTTAGTETLTRMKVHMKSLRGEKEYRPPQMLDLSSQATISTDEGTGGYRESDKNLIGAKFVGDCFKME